MDRLDPETDLSFVLGQAVEQVCRGLYQLRLNLSGDVTIAIESTTEYRHGGSAVTWRWWGGSHDEFPIYGLLNVEVSELAILDGGTLRLRFANADEITIIADTEPESYQIMHGSTYIVV